MAGPAEHDVWASFATSLSDFVTNLSDWSVSNSKLTSQFFKLMELRKPVAAANGGGSLGLAGFDAAKTPAVDTRTTHLVETIIAKLEATENFWMTIQDLCADPQVKEARTGVTVQITKLLGGDPTNFTLFDMVVQAGKTPVQCVRLASAPEPDAAAVAVVTPTPKAGAKKRPAPASSPAAVPSPAGEGVSRQAILDHIVNKLANAGLELPLSKLTHDKFVKSNKKGVVSSMTKFLAQFPETFELVSGTAANDPMVRLLQLPTARAAGPVVAEPPAKKARTTFPTFPALGGVPKGSKGARAVQALPGGPVRPQPVGAVAQLPVALRWPVQHVQAAQPVQEAAPGSTKAANKLLAAQAQEKRQQLVEYIQQLLIEVPERALRIEDLAQMEDVQALRHGAVQKLRPFLESQVAVFKVYDAEDDAGRPVKCVTLREEE